MKKRDVIFAVLGILLLLFATFLAMNWRRAELTLCAQNVAVIANDAFAYAGAENGWRMPASFSSNWIELDHLVCPYDSGRRRARDWSFFTASNTSYVILSPGMSLTDSLTYSTPYVTCRIHTNYLGGPGWMRGFDPNAY